MALEALGQGLHALQDIDAHMQIFAGQSVTFSVHKDGNGNTKTIDDTQYDMYLGKDGKYYPTQSKGAYNSDRYKNTEKASIEYLKRFKTAISK